MIKTILFDLDGTLLPMEQEEFVKAYFGLLANKASNYGYDKETLIKTIWKGTEDMIKNDGSTTNEEVFWKTFKNIYGDDAIRDKYIFDDFYLNEFQKIQRVCGYTKHAKEIIDKAKSKGYKIVLATNPIFPSIATESRIRWAGLDPKDFEIYTTYENCNHSKPNLQYYKDILTRINCNETECLMVGNDVDEDMIVSKLGMKTFLLTDCLINKSNKDINIYNSGSYIDLLKYLDEM